MSAPQQPVDGTKSNVAGQRASPLLAAVDIGSNSFRLHIGQHNGRSIEVIRSERVPTRLAAGLDQSGSLTAAAMQLGIDSLHHLGSILKAYQLDAIRAVGTNTLRIANNTATFLPYAEQALGYPIEVISGEEEARLIYMGLANQLAIPGERRLVVDIGGGSTELILGCGQEIERAESINIGTVRQSHHFFPDGAIDETAFNSAIMYARSRFEDVFPPSQRSSWKSVYGSSGTMRAIGEIIARNNLGSEVLSRRNLLALKRVITGYGRIDRLKLEKLRSDRAESIVGGLAILIGLMDELQIEKIKPVEGGLRLGVMWDLHLLGNQRDRREQSVRGFFQRFSSEAGRANKVAEYATALYGQLKPETDTYAKLLRWSAVLHEVGLAVSPTNYHKHGAYLIENADLSGFTTREQRTMGKLILGQKGNLRKLSSALDNQDVIKAVLALRIAVMFMQTHIAADFNELRLRMKNRIELEIRPSLTLEHPTLPYWIEREQLFWEEIGMNFVVKFRS